MQGKKINITKLTFEKILTYGLGPVIFAVALLIGLISLNYVVSTKAGHLDVSQVKRNTLSQQTLNLLEQIDFDVTIKVFYPDNVLRDISNLLQRYQHVNTHLKVEYIDPIKRPIEAERYEVTTPRTIVFSSENSTTRLAPSPRTRTHREREISTALFRLLTDQDITVYFTTGHGELSIEDTGRSGLSIIAGRLEEQNFIVKTVNLLQEGQVPDDCDLLIIPGLTVPLTEEEVEILESYAQHRGQVLLMMNPGESSGLDNMYNEYGIAFGNDYVYETSRKMTIEAGPFYVFCTPPGPHEITDKLPNQMFLMPLVRSVYSWSALDGVEKDVLLASSPDSWAETDLKSIQTLGTNVRPTRGPNERKGPVPVALTLERKFYLPASIATTASDTETSRSAFFGNSHFISNAYVSAFPSNTNLFLNTVNWITQNENFLVVVPHVPPFTPVDLRQSQRRTLLWITYLYLPLSIILVGLTVWYRRR